jgi:GDPmannose 4,6-dehydratase
LVRRSSSFNTGRLDHLYRDRHDPGARLFLHFGDLADGSGMRRVLEQVRPDEVYNLGAQSHVRVSFDQAEYTADVTALGALRLLEAVRDHMTTSGRTVRVYQAGSSEMFGAAPAPQDERTPFHPRSPYGVSKVAAHWYGVNYRESYGMFVANGILFNHESPRRGETFVTRKITRAVGRIVHGLQDTVFLGNLEARRDWGFAGDYVEAMWRMLHTDVPGDFVVATGVSHSVRDLLDAAFGRVGLDWARHVRHDPRYERPAEVDVLCGNPEKASQVLGWAPTVTFEGLVAMMVDADLALAARERAVAAHDAARGGAR